MLPALSMSRQMAVDKAVVAVRLGSLEVLARADVQGTRRVAQRRGVRLPLLPLTSFMHANSLVMRVELGLLTTARAEVAARSNQERMLQALMSVVTVALALSAISMEPHSPMARAAAVVLHEPAPFRVQEVVMVEAFLLAAAQEKVVAAKAGPLLLEWRTAVAVVAAVEATLPQAARAVRALSSFAMWSRFSRA